jgi:hypothetical protein
LPVPHGAESPLARQTRRLKLNTNHTIAKRIPDTHPHACIELEELSGIRDRTKRKHGKKASDATAPCQPTREQVGLRRAARAAHL